MPEWILDYKRAGSGRRKFFHGLPFQRSAVRSVISCPCAAKVSLASSAYESLMTGGYEAVSFLNRPKLLPHLYRPRECQKQIYSSRISFECWTRTLKYLHEKEATFIFLYFDLTLSLLLHSNNCKHKKNMAGQMYKVKLLLLLRQNRWGLKADKSVGAVENICQTFIREPQDTVLTSHPRQNVPCGIYFTYSSGEKSTEDVQKGKEP